MFSSQSKGGGGGEGLILKMKKFRSTKERERKEEILGIMIKPFGVDNKILSSILQTNICAKQCLIVSIITIKYNVKFFSVW